MPSSQLKTNFTVNSKYEAFYTGGKIQLSRDGESLFCCCGNKVQILNVKTGRIIQAVGQEDDEEVTCFCISPEDKILVVASRNLLLRQWDLSSGSLSRTWKAIHVAPITCLTFDQTSTLVASGSSDSTIKVWDVERQYCTHNLRGHQGVVTVVQFHPDSSKLQIITAAEDYKIRVWDLTTSTCIAILDKHFSVITSIDMSTDGKTLYSSGRDSIVVVWDLESYAAKKTIPVFEAIESVVLLDPSKDYPALNASKGGQYFITAGSKGVLKVWNSDKASCVYTQENNPVAYKAKSSPDLQDDAIIKQAVYHPVLDTITVVTYDHYILMFKADDFSLDKQFAGNNDEVLDIKFLGEDETHIAVATNSELIKVFSLSSWDCQILHGHTDIVLALDVSKKGDLLISSAKDNSIRVWKMCQDTHKLTCVGVGNGHTHGVGTVAFSRLSSDFVVSGSQDCTLKSWSLPPSYSDSEVVTLHTTVTEKAHEKDINSVAVAPNDKFIATGSQDKTAKLWKADTLSLVGVMRGHKRGIWCVQFSPVDQCIATSSSDGYIKIWSLTDFSCVKTFEGHDSSVLQVQFLTRGMQLMTCGSDGLLKLWTIKSNECAKTLEEHTEKVWTLACTKREDMIVSGGGDAAIIVWKDSTLTDIEEKMAKQEDFIIKEQELSNLLQQKKYLKAIGLAITLEQPFRVLKIIKEILLDPDGEEGLVKTVKKLRMDQLDSVLRYSCQWNTNSKHCHEAQYVLSIVLKTYTPEELMTLANLKSTLEGLIPYTERHFQRMNKLLQSSNFTEYMWHCMKLGDNSAGNFAINKDATTSFFIDSSGHAPADDEETTEKDAKDNDENADDLGLMIRRAVERYKKQSDEADEKKDEEVDNQESAVPDKSAEDMEVENTESAKKRKKKKKRTDITVTENDTKETAKAKRQIDITPSKKLKKERKSIIADENQNTPQPEEINDSAKKTRTGRKNKRKSTSK